MPAGPFSFPAAETTLLLATYDASTKGSTGEEKTMTRLGFLSLVAGTAAAALAGLAGHTAWSQAGRTIRLVVPFPPGGSADILARLLGEQIGKAHGVSTVVENRPGGGASIAYESVARAAPDGNTLVIAANSVVINPLLRKTTYDPLTSYEPICYLVSAPTIYAVNGASPYRTLADLVAAARAQPGALSLASVGPATTHHIGFEQLKRAAGIDMVYVPYAGGAPSVTAALGGHVNAVFANYSEMVEQLKAGTLRALATGGRKRIEPLPDVPTVAESGYKDYDVEVWFAVLAPAKTPPETTAQLASWFTAAMEAREVTPKLKTVGLYPVGLCGADFAAYLRKQSEEYGRIIRAANIKTD
jgi:tripartite-type tricarboxylate transporter receptor subunit TctC